MSGISKKTLAELYVRAEHAREAAETPPEIVAGAVEARLTEFVLTGAVPAEDERVQIDEDAEIARKLGVAPGG